MIAYVLAAILGGEPWKLMMGAAGIIAAAQVSLVGFNWLQCIDGLGFLVELIYHQQFES